MMNDLVKSIETWFALAKPNPKDSDVVVVVVVVVVVQIGCHFEEVSEMLAAIKHTKAQLQVQRVAEFYKDAGCCGGELVNPNRTALLDALCDQIVTAIGVGQLMGFDMAGALAEVNRSNYSRFENGQPVFTGQGKIAKDYAPPELGQFLGIWGDK